MSKKKLVLVNDELSAQIERAEAAAAKIEGRTGQTNTYWHQEAARLRALLTKPLEVEDGKLEQ